MTAHSAVTKLRQFVAGPVERCDFCRARLADWHSHLVETENLRLVCACAGCAAEMTEEGLPYRRVEPRQEALEAFALADADWAMLGIPIDLAFLFRPEAGAAPVALFPGPAGATRSHLSEAVWTGLTRKYPLLGELEPSTEALLVNRSGGRRDHYRVSADHCFALTGLMRKRWRGLGGGEEAWAAIDAYIADLAQTSSRRTARHA